MKYYKRILLAGLLLGGGISLQAETTDSLTVYMVSNAHLDTQWNWDIQSTIKSHVWNTIDKNLSLLETYPDYIFNFEGGVKYSWMKEYYPREYERLKQHIASGRWHISGASWDANDVNVPSVESNIRNILLGQTFYRDEFGVESTDIFLPDCFGFGWALPTIASHCGLIGFSSQKLGWREKPFYGDRKYPFSVGLWEGVDGARIMMVHGYGYGTRFNDEDLTANEYVRGTVEESPTGVGYHYYGTGDIGGSPTLTSVVSVDRAARGGEGPLKVVSATSDQLYKYYMPYEAHPELPVFNGELTMDVHGTGCYTSQAAMKLYNRQNELLGDAAERASVSAELLGLSPYPSDALTTAWRRFIFHQFHDDLTGTSIPRAYEFSWNDELLSLKQFSDIITHSSAAVASRLDTRVKGTPVVVYNALGHDVTDIVEFSLPASRRPAKVAVTGADGRKAECQIVDYRDGKVYCLVEASVPANGYAVLDVQPSGAAKGISQPREANTIENSLYRLTFNPDGDITSLVVKADGRELVKEGRPIRLAMFDENESKAWPAWEIIKKTLDRDPVSITDGVVMTLVEQGPLRTTLLVEKQYGDSKFRQYVRLYEGELAERIDFYNEVDWASTNALLKADIPLTAANPTATYDLGVGSIERGNNTDIAYEVVAQRWADLTDAGGGYGVTVMSDCKYGWDKPDDNTLRHTLIHTPKTGAAYSYQDHQDLGHHTFTYSLLPHTGVLDKAKASRDADRLAQRVKAFVTDRHPGNLGRSFSLASSANDAVAIKAIKRAESSDDYVVRVYETSGTGDATSEIRFPFPIREAYSADGTEKRLEKAPFSGNTLTAKVNKNGIATYLLKFDTPEMSQSGSYTAVALPYDKKCFSRNKFEFDADFSQGYSYAQELIPDNITVDGVPFAFATASLCNGKECRGDKINVEKGKYNRLYLLAATASELGGAEGVVRAGKTATALNVPSYTGFVGQWGHSGHTEGYLLQDQVAYVGTHRHSPEGDVPYEFTYMYKYVVDIPADATEITLPENPDIVVFAATLARESDPAFAAAAPLYRTSIPGEMHPVKKVNTAAERENLLSDDKIIGWSGYVNEVEHPRFLNDGNISTKWCDAKNHPAYVDYDLGALNQLGEWSILGAASENPSYITATCLLQVKRDASDDWETVDMLVGNKRNEVTRKLGRPVDARYVRLLVVQPEQGTDIGATRIYEFSVR